MLARSLTGLSDQLPRHLAGAGEWPVMLAHYYHSTLFKNFMEKLLSILEMRLFFL